MQLAANQLPRHLREGRLCDVYLATGDEQLLVDEACDDILAAAQKVGFSERTPFEAAPRAPWNELFADAANLSLFASKRVLDIRIPARGLDRPGSDALRNYIKAPLADTLMVCRAIGLEWRQRSSAWFKAIEKAGAVVPIWPISARDLPRWLAGRCKRHGLALSRDAVDLLAERVEGNLLAAQQEIEKLKLLHAGEAGEAGEKSMAEAAQAIDVEQVIDAVGDSAHFDTFELIDAAFAGQAARVRKMLNALRLEGVPVFMVLGALLSQLRRARQLASGGNPRLPRNRQQAVAAAVRRLGADGIDALVRECACLDLQAKGMLRGEPWQSLERILLAVAGLQPPTLGEEADLLRDQPYY